MREERTVKVAPPTNARMQCPRCGVPVDSLEVVVEGPLILLEPCEHLVQPGALVSGY